MAELGQYAAGESSADRADKVRRSDMERGQRQRVVAARQPLRPAWHTGTNDAGTQGLAKLRYCAATKRNEVNIMNLWILVAILATALFAGASFLGMRRLTKSIGNAIASAAKSKWHGDDVTRLLRKLALLSSVFLLLHLLPWSLLFTTLGGMADQYFRNTVNQWMSGPDLFQHLALDHEQYSNQPLHWRQALAEISLREGDEDESLRQFISQLGTQEIQLLETVAEYALSGALLYARDTVQEFSASDLMHLEAIGVIDSRLPLNHKRIRLETDAASGTDVTESLWLVGHQYGIHLRALMPENEASLSFNVLTENGERLVEALRRPASLAYLCGLHRNFHSMQMSAVIWSIDRQGLDGYGFRKASEITDVCESIDVTTQ